MATQADALSVWRTAIAPQHSRKALEALRRGLETNDPALQQKATVAAASTEGVDFGEAGTLPPCRACSVAYAEWHGRELKTIDEVAKAFEKVMGGVGKLMEFVTYGCDFIDWHDSAPWPEVRAALLAEVKAELQRRDDQLAQHQ